VATPVVTLAMRASSTRACATDAQIGDSSNSSVKMRIGMGTAG
jgi:hypothetical protein